MDLKILIIDDSLYMRTVINDVLSKEGYQIAGEASNGESAIEMAKTLRPDILILDNTLPDMTGATLIKKLRQENIQGKILMICAIGQQGIIDEGLSLGISEYIIKPFTVEHLLETVNKVVNL